MLHLRSRTICYLVINFLLVGRLNKLVPAEVLKNRE